MLQSIFILILCNLFYLVPFPVTFLPVVRLVVNWNRITFQLRSAVPSEKTNHNTDVNKWDMLNPRRLISSDSEAICKQTWWELPFGHNCVRVLKVILQCRRATKTAAQGIPSSVESDSSPSPKNRRRTEAPPLSRCNNGGFERLGGLRDPASFCLRLSGSRMFSKYRV